MPMEFGVRASRSARAVRFGALLLSAALSWPCAVLAQTMSFTGASPSTFGGAGEIITFTLSFGGSNAITNSVSLTGMNYSPDAGSFSCAGLPLQPGDSTTCSFTYTTQAGDTFSITQFGSWSATTPSAPRSGSITNQQVVTYVPPPSVTISRSPASVAEDGASNIVYTITRSSSSASSLTVNLSASGSATSGTDYTGFSSTVTIAANATSTTLSIDPTLDSNIEADETVSITVDTGTGYTVGSPSSAAGTISNDDVPTATIAVSPASVAEDGAPNLVFTVTLNPVNPLASTTLNYTAGGTATNGTDYATITSPLVIPAGSTTGTITVNPTPDASIEAGETATITLNSGTGYNVGSPSSATGNILNDDLPNLTINDVTASEGNAGTTNFTFTVSLSAPAGPGGVTFDIATANGTAIAGTDYAANSLTGQTIPAGSSTYTFAVQVNGDTLNEPNETFFVNTTNVTNAVVVDGQGLGTIANDDPLPSLSINDVTVIEGDSGNVNAVFTVTLSAASGQTVTVNHASADGTGTQPADYASTSGTLTFTPGQTTRTITVPVVGETDAEVNETFFVNLSGATNATISDNQGVGTITNDDAPPVANNSSLTVAYNASAANVPLSISGGTPASLTIGTAPQNGAAIVSGTAITYQPTAGYAGPDSFTYTATNASGTSAAATVSITVQDPVITITTSGSFSATAGTAYTQTFAFNGGAQPWSGFQVINLPAGLSITGTSANTATISGAPTQAGTFNLNVSATDSSTGNGPYTVGQAFTLTVGAPTLTLAPPAGTLSAPYATPFSQAFTAGGGIGPYTISVTGTLPAGITLSGDTLSGTPTIPGSYPITVTATDTGATGTGAPFTIAHNYTVDVAAPTVVVNPASLPNATAGTAYSQTMTAAGGAAPYTFALTSGALPTGLTLTTAGLLSGTPTASGSFPISVRATDAHGQTGTRNYTLVAGVPGLTLTPASVPAGVAGSAYSQVFAVTGGIAPVTVSLAGTLPAGLTFNAATGTLSGTPTASGSFSFSLTATDSTGGTPATVTNSYTLAIGTPALTLAPATLPAGTGGVPYNQTLAASGGIAPYTYALTSGTLPPGLTLSAAGVLGGTPTAVGSSNISVRATDSTGGTAATVTNNYSLVINAPAITITPATLPNGVNGAAYSQSLSASGGTAPYVFAVTAGALPAGLTLSNAGVLSGTPSVVGNSNFTVRATDALGFTGTLAYAFAVVNAPPVAADDTATTLGSTPVNIAVTANDSGVFTAIAIATAPANGSASVNGLNVTYTANASFSGADTFTYTLSGPGGSATASVTVTVNPVPVALSRTVDAIAGVPVTVDLTQGATGGPFTAAHLVSLTPANAGTVSIAQSGTAFQLSFTPAASFSGAASAVFTLNNAFATSAQATITFNVAVRPNPAQDTEVRALLEAQVDSTRRFATGQITNFQQRLESLHGAGESGAKFANALTFSAPQSCSERAGARPGFKCNQRGVMNGLSADGLSLALSRELRGASAAADSGGAGTRSGVRFWAGGVIRSGDQDGRGNSAGVEFESDGISLGADYRITPSFSFGAGVGFGRDRSEVGQRESNSENHAYSAAFYASYHPGETFFLDGLLGYQWLDYDLRRTVTTNGNDVKGQRDGNQWFASLAAGAHIQRNAWQFTPYGRIDFSQARLDGYTERGDPTFALRYDQMDVDTGTASLGLRVDYRLRTGWGMFAPQLRVEHQHDFTSDAKAQIRYADLFGPIFEADVLGFERDRTSLGLGLLFNTNKDWSFRIEYRALVGDNDTDNSVQFGVEKRY